MGTVYDTAALKRGQPWQWVPSQLPYAPPAGPLHLFQQQLSLMHNLQTEKKQRQQWGVVWHAYIILQKKNNIMDVARA